MLFQCIHNYTDCCYSYIHQLAKQLTYIFTAYGYCFMDIMQLYVCMCKIDKVTSYYKDALLYTQLARKQET